MYFMVRSNFTWGIFYVLFSTHQQRMRDNTNFTHINHIGSNFLIRTEQGRRTLWWSVCWGVWVCAWRTCGTKDLISLFTSSISEVLSALISLPAEALPRDETVKGRDCMSSPSSSQMYWSSHHRGLAARNKYNWGDGSRSVEDGGGLAGRG